MHRERLIQCVAGVLLMAFLTMVVSTSLHKHRPVVAEKMACEACIHHKVHAAHFDSLLSSDAHQCFFCQFLNYIVWIATTAATFVVALVGSRYAKAERDKLRHAEVVTIKARAPPIV